MSRRPVVKYTAFNALSAAATQTQSQPTNVENTDTASYHVKFSAANSGTFRVQARNRDLLPAEDILNTWYDVNFGSPLTITAETDVQIVFNELPFKEIRLIWEPSAGSGTVSAYLLMKAKGA
jgi:hypothetical protein